MRKNYEMTEEQLSKLLRACQPTPAMYLPGGRLMGSTPQEKANHAWARLGEELGFKSMTVEPTGEGDRFFSAEPTEEEAPDER